MTEFDPFAEPDLGSLEETPLDPQVEEALSEGAHLSDESLPPLKDEPLKTVIEGYIERTRNRPRTPEPSLENARKDPNASVFLEAWGEEVFLGSAYYEAWQAEWRHQALKDAAREKTVKE